jgi:hypothetical protein
MKGSILPRFQAVNEKYLLQKNLGIARMPPTPYLPVFVHRS